MARFPHRGRLVAALTGAAAAVAAIPLALVTAASPAAADTSQFAGVNWARLGDNFHGGPLVLHGLSGSDSYTTVRAKADAIYSGFERNLGVNTIRLPINTYSVGTAWWNSYTGTIDAATARGMKVILSFWEDGAAGSGGRIVNTAAFNAMWNTVVAKYGANSLVYFEPMNEPHGHSATDWKNVAAAWLSARPSVPRNRVFISGTGYNQDIKTMCADSRFNGTYLSLHYYAFFSGAKTYDAWVSDLRNAIGTCASRTIIDEFGAPMDTGLNYNDANSTDNFVRYFRATTQVLRELRMGSVYWPGLGGKITAGQNDDFYAMQKLQGSGTNLTLTTPSASGSGRLRYAWGAGSGTPSPTPPAASSHLRNTATNRCLNALATAPADGLVDAATCVTTAAQQGWTVTSTGQITAFGGQKCLDAYNQGTVNGTTVGTYACNGGTNQRWTVNADGTIRGVQSNLCLDVSVSTNRVMLWSCHGGSNQRWQIQRL